MQIAQRVHDEHWMDRALELARMGEAQASPNPMVGAVVVKDGRAIGRAFHTYEGLRHAEVLALDSAGPAARCATLYVNLEPCCHTAAPDRVPTPSWPQASGKSWWLQPTPTLPLRGAASSSFAPEG